MGGEAPTGVWDRIAAELEESPPPIAIERFRSGAPAVAGGRRAVSSLAVSLLAAAAVLVIALLAVQVVAQDRRIERLANRSSTSGIDEAIAAASADPDARTVELASGDGALQARVVLLDGRGYVVGGNLPALPAGQTYQLWAKSGDALLSVGVLGAKFDRTGFAVGVDPELLAITAERSPGVLSSKNVPVVVGDVPARSA